MSVKSQGFHAQNFACLWTVMVFVSTIFVNVLFNYVDVQCNYMLLFSSNTYWCTTKYTSNETNSRALVISESQNLVIQMHVLAAEKVRADESPVQNMRT